MTIASPVTAPADLPFVLTRFVGRARELDELSALLPSTRLLTLTGAGGSGKTRLARELAEHAAPQFELVAWVDLAPLSDPALLPERLALALQAPEATDDAPLSCITRAICTRSVLLVLDNCEHLVDACAGAAEWLLRGCSRLRVVATSREALGVAGETAWLVPALSMADAVQLFVDRAQATAPGFTLTDASAETIADICRRLDGIPLAIELAAARARVLSPEQIARRLDDAFRLLSAGSRTALPRHRTLRATMDWSHALLDAREQALLRRLAVFAGSFTLDAVEAVCAGAPLDAEDLLDGLTTLVDKSLVALVPGVGDARYRLLETVRQYGLERLDAAGERDAAERRHAEFFTTTAEQGSAPLYASSMYPEHVERLAADHDNLRAAMAWSVRDAGPDAEPDVARAEIALRLASALFWYWYSSTMEFSGGLYREARRFIETALARSGSCDPRLVATAQTALGLVGLATTDLALAERGLNAAMPLARQQGNATHVTFLHAKLGAVHLMRGALDDAAALLDTAAAGLDPAQPTMLDSFVNFWHAWVHMARGDFTGARAVGERHLQVGTQLGHVAVSGHSNTIMGLIELQSGHVDRAFLHFTDALRYHLAPRDSWGIMLDLEGLAHVATARRRYADAVRILGGSDAVSMRTSTVVPPMISEAHRELMVRLAERLGDDAIPALLAEGMALPIADLAGLACDDAIGQTAEFAVVSVPAPRADAASTAPGSGPLRVQALGPLTVQAGDVPIDAAAWGSARPRELLVYLLLHPEGRTKEQVGLAFWPDASPAQLRNNFHVTLHRLRRALRRADYIVQRHERYAIAPALLAGFDALDFEREVVAAQKALQRGDAGAAARLDAALSLCRGDLLDGEPAGDWHHTFRDRYQRLFADGVMALGQWHLHDDRPQRAAEAFRRLLARDPLHEGAVQGLMRAHAAVGERPQALRVYRRFAELLARDLDSEPERETTTLADELARGL